MRLEETACKEVLVQGVKLGDRLRRAYTSSYLLGTSPLHGKSGSPKVPRWRPPEADRAGDWVGYLPSRAGYRRGRGCAVEWYSWAGA